MQQSGARLEAHGRRWPRTTVAAAAMVAVAVGAAVLAGWSLDLTILTALASSWPTMKANTALCFVLLGTSLWLLGVPDPGHGRAAAGRALAGTAALIGSLTLLEYALGRGLGLDEILFRDPSGAPYPGRMSIPTALGFVLLGTSLLLLDARGRRGSTAGVLALAAALIAYTIVAGYVYGVPFATELRGLVTMALHTVLGQLVLAMGVIAARPDRGILPALTGPGPAGIMARRLLPAAILIPLAVGGLRLAAQYPLGLFGTRFGLSLMVGSTVALLIVVILLTTRRLERAEAARAEAEELLHLRSAALEATADGIVITDREGTITWVNPAFTRLTGYPAEEAVGQNPRILRSGRQDTSFYRRMWQTILAGEVWEGRLVNRRKDGTVYVEEQTITPVRDGSGGIGHFVAVKRDVTDRERLEEALRESEERYRLLAESSLTGVYLIQDGRFRYVNPALAAIFGYEVEEIVGKLGPLDLTAPEDHELVAENIRRREQGGVVGIRYAFRGRRKDGSAISVEVHGTRIDYEGRPAIIGTLLDVTERQRAEDEIRALNIELERRVAERTAELEATVRELDAFAYSVSHDLRAPLRAMDGFSRILMEREASAIPEDTKHYLERIREGARRMGVLIDDLLALSRLGRKPLRKERVQTEDVVRRVLSDVQEAHGRPIEVTVGDLPTCRADPALLAVVFTNLLDNAFKFTRDRPDARIEVGAETDGPGVPTFFVRDNGAGFDMAYADKLFGVFQRLHRAEEFEGTGVGLATVQRIVHRHGGRIWAEAAPGAGATFRFTLEGGSA